MRLLLAGPCELRILSAAGETLRTLAPPPGYDFSHVLEGERVVVCRASEPVDGWYDWHFAVDLASGALTRTGPAY